MNGPRSTPQWLLWSLGVIGSLVLLAGLPLVAAPQPAPDIHETKCVDRPEVCNPPVPPVQPERRGPSPKDLQDQREAEDLAEHQTQASKANQKGLKAFNNGDWEKAIKYFREAVRNDFENRVYRKNLDQAFAQARAAEETARTAAASPSLRDAHKKAEECFDRGTCTPSPTDTKTVDLRNAGHRPQVPAWMTKDPGWQKLDKQMGKLKEQEQTIQKELTTLQETRAKGDDKTGGLQMQIVEKKQELSKKATEIAVVRQQMVDLSIDLGNIGPPASEMSRK